MQLLTQKIESAKSKSSELLWSCLAVGSGFLLLSGLSQVEIPLIPVPISLQTFALFLLGLFYTPRHAALAAIAYLAAATGGAPVLSGGASKALWMLYPSAGYLLAFPATAYTIARIRSRMSSPTMLKVFLALLSGQVVLYAGGLSVLSFHIGLSNVLAVGLFPFIPGALLKMSAAVCCDKALLK